MSTDGTPASRNSRWSSSMAVDSLTNSRLAEACGRAPDRVGQPGGRVRLAQDAQILVADHVDQHERARCVLSVPAARAACT